MELAQKIKHYRQFANLTQSELAEKLYVSPQTVSKWENGENEPNIDTLRKLVAIFNISIEELLSNEPPVVAVPVEKLDTEVVDQVAEAVVKKQKAAEGEKIQREFAAKKAAEQALADQTKKSARKVMIASIIFGALLGVAAVIGVIVLSVKDPDLSTTNGILVAAVLGYLIFSFVFTMSMQNTQLNAFFLGIVVKGAVRFPGIIFSFSLDGFIFLVLMKILFRVLGILIAGFFLIVGIILTVLVSGFFFPFSLYRAIKKPEKTAYY